MSTTGHHYTPHDVQVLALRELSQTRTLGEQAGLVVLATGLGKTWLSAFDFGREFEFKTLLFVAHRKEILEQARKTFLRLDPSSNTGLYTGEEKTEEADLVFASVQALSRLSHLQRFPRDRFDYLVIDEFHHAAAKSYRRVLEYFEPKFLLGLTATPERTDGGDLLKLCGGNLVYRCDLKEGIERGLLAPFRYFGVPDDIDYANIPWRGGRFEEASLDLAWATER